MISHSFAHARSRAQKGFTLIELIIVITILVVLGIVVVVLIDPAEILAQSRDSQRISDLASVKAATQLVLTAGVPSNASTVCYTGGTPESAPNATSSTPASSKVYSSLLTDIGTTGYRNDVGTSTGQLVNGTGYIQVDYTTPSTGRALTSLPVDPTNTRAGGLHYRWGCNYYGGVYQYEIDAVLESAKYKPGCTAANCDDKGTRDGGNSNGTGTAATTNAGNDRYEVGNNLNVLPVSGATS